MIRTLVIAAVFAVGATAVVAQGDPIAQRKAAMKSTGQAIGPMAGMMKGERPFDLATVKTSLETMNKVSKEMGALFPATSKTGGDTEALPAVWDNAAGWNEAIKKFQDASAAALVNVKDEASFKAEFPKVAANCGGCHTNFRVKK